MSEMVERVAQAIDKVIGDELESFSIEMGCGSLSSKMRAEEVEKAARAAIEAMRESSDKMIEAGAKAMVGSDEDAMECWPAMIDEALK